MRDYSKVSGQFWTGKTGRELRGNMQAQVVALYLMTTHHANMIGVFHCPLVYIAHETGVEIEGASKGLQTLIEGGFCTYDHDSETVWVHEMAKYQIGSELKVSDNRVKDIQKQFANLPEGQIKQGFGAKYRSAFHLLNQNKNVSPSEAPPKPEAVTVTVTETETETEEKTKRAPRFDPQKYLVELGVSPDLATDWIDHRKSVKAKPSKTAIDGIAQEAEKAQMSLSDALRESCSRGWRGFKAEWMENKTQNARASPSGQSWHDRQAETIAILTGRNKQNEPERDITGEARRVA